jgi:arsenite methyltransferase
MENEQRSGKEVGMTDHNPTADSLLKRVRDRYAAAARAVTNRETGSCCDTTRIGDASCAAAPIALDETGLGATQYDNDSLDQLPVDAVLASLGCGNPTAIADLHLGEIVLDLGSGGGIDVLLSARRVGPTGHAYGLDMTDEMLDLARANAAAAGATNVEFLKGHMEAIPLPDASVDVVISNCVVNLSPDKHAVFAEVHRVLKPGGRIGISDLVADDNLTPDDRARMGTHADCIAGALTSAEYTRHLSNAGFTEITLTRSHTVADGLHSTIIQATKPTPS